MLIKKLSIRLLVTNGLSAIVVASHFCLKYVLKTQLLLSGTSITIAANGDTPVFVYGILSGIRVLLALWLHD